MKIVFEKLHLRLFNHLGIRIFAVTEESNELKGTISTRHDLAELLGFFRLEGADRENLEEVIGQELVQGIEVVAEMVKQKKSDFKFDSAPIFKDGYFMGGRGSYSPHFPSFAHAFAYLGSRVENTGMEPERAVALLQHLLSVGHPIRVDGE